MIIQEIRYEPSISLGAIIMFIAAIIPTIITWVRLGPRMDSLEKWRDDHVKLSQQTQNTLTRLVALSEIMDRRIERVEDRK